MIECIWHVGSKWFGASAQGLCSCSLTVSDAFQSSLRMLEHTAASSSSPPQQGPKHQKLLEASLSRPETRRPCPGRAYHPTAIRVWTNGAPRWADPVTMPSWSVFDSSVVQSGDAVQERDALCNESRLSSLDIGNAKELTMARTNHSDSCLGVIKIPDSSSYVCIYIYINILYIYVCICVCVCIYYIHSTVPVVPHKAVAEVSR